MPSNDRRSLDVTCHRDGSVTYWSVYTQCWLQHVYAVPDKALAAMRASERARVIRHLEQHAEA